MKNNKGSVSLVVLGLAFIAVLIGGYFMVGKNINPTIQNISPTLTLPTSETVAPESEKPIDTSSWKDYKNDQFGFEFSYPDIIAVTEAKKEWMRPGELFSVGMDYKVNIEAQKKMMEELAVSGGGIDGFATTLQMSYIHSGIKPSCEKTDFYGSATASQIYLNGLLWDQCISYGEMNSPIFTLTHTVDDSNYVKIYAESYVSGNDKVIDKIISSFKFTK